MSKQQNPRMSDVKLKHRINAGRAAVNAQKAFLRRQFGQVTSEWKADATRVTFADFAISENISTELRRDFPEDVYCSEEANPQDEVLSLTDTKFAWVIDPIDGTNNYALGFPICAISLALLCEGTPIYGFIYDYSTDALLEGGPGMHVFSNQKKIKNVHESSDTQVIFGVHFPMDAELLDQLKPLLTKYRVRSVGSSALSAVYVATGYLDGMVDARCKVWDIAAACAICAGAGVEFEFLEASPFPLKSFHARMSFCPYFAARKPFYDELKACLND